MKKIIAIMMAITLFAATSSTAMAASNSTTEDIKNVPVIMHPSDFGCENAGEEITVDENGYIVTYRDISNEEREIANKFMQPHKDETMLRHFNILVHSHSIESVKSSTKTGGFYTSNIWTKNSLYPNEASWPTVAWNKSDSYTVATNYSLSVNVPADVLKVTLGAQYTTSHTVATSTTRTFKVPYKMQGNVRVTYTVPYKTFACVTTYDVTSGGTIVKQRETGAGYASGAPYDIGCDLAVKAL